MTEVILESRTVEVPSGSLRCMAMHVVQTLLGGVEQEAGIGPCTVIATHRYRSCTQDMAVCDAFAHQVMAEKAADPFRRTGCIDCDRALFDCCSIERIAS